MKKAKILVIGCGGIGSYVAKELHKLKHWAQINADVTLADADIAEPKQLWYQNFEKKDVGQYKAKVLARRYKHIAMAERVTEDKIIEQDQLKPYDIILLCVDNEKTRKLVIEYCHNTGKEFIDARSTGRKIFCMPKYKEMLVNMKYVDAEDMNEYSCQEEETIKRGEYDYGNRISAMVIIQMLLNHLRGYRNRMISIII